MGTGIMKRLSDQLGLATVTNLEGSCRVTNVPMNAGTFAQSSHFKGTAALRAGMRGQNHLKVKRPGFLLEIIYSPDDIQDFQQ